MERTSGDCPVPAPAQSRVTHSRLPRAASSCLLNVSKDGDSTTPLGNRLQCSTSLKVKNDLSYFLNRIAYSGKTLSCRLSQRAAERPSGHHQASRMVAVLTAASQKGIRVRDTRNSTEVRRCQRSF